jgi:alpha/beta superfamily hydrolase
MIEFKDNETVLLGQWFEPKNQENFPAVILATGDGPSGSKGLTWTNIVPKFLEKGIGCFLFDFDGLGHSPNLRRELTLTKGISNIKAAILEMKKNPRLDKTRLAGFGSSFGGNILLLTAHLEDNFKVLGLKSPCCFIAEAFTCEIGLDKVESWSKTGFSKEAGFNYSAFLDSYNYNTFKTASLIDIPVKVVHGSKDSAVPLRQSLDLMKFLEKGELYTIEGADHWYSEGNEWEIMAEQLVDYIAKHI